MSHAKNVRLIQRLKENNLLKVDGTIKSLYYKSDEIDETGVLCDVLAVPYELPHLIYWSPVVVERSGNIAGEQVIDILSPYLANMTDEERIFVEEQIRHVLLFHTVTTVDTWDGDIFLYVNHQNHGHYSMQIVVANMLPTSDEDPSFY